jgi:N6-adenosine-specific RNA methylase IME4
MQVYARQAKDTDLIEHATDIRMRAEIKAGELLAQMAAGGQRAKSGQADGSGRKPSVPQLKDLGVTKTQSSRWQRLAALDETERERRIDKAKRKQMAALTSGLTRRTREDIIADDIQRCGLLTPRAGKFRTLVLDPPWDFSAFGPQGNRQPAYAPMSQEELLALPVREWVEEDAHLYLWATNLHMPDACELMQAWGFDHKTILTWVKPKWGLGDYFRNQTEHVLFGVRGKLSTKRGDISTVFEAPVGEHSEKPERFYEIVRAASHPPYGEVFQRTERPDFANVFVMADEREAVA